MIKELRFFLPILLINSESCGPGFSTNLVISNWLDIKNQERVHLRHSSLIFVVGTFAIVAKIDCALWTSSFCLGRNNSAFNSIQHGRINYFKEVRRFTKKNPVRLRTGSFLGFHNIYSSSSEVRSAFFTGTPSGLSAGGVVVGVFFGKEGYTGGSKRSFPVAGIAGSPRWCAILGSGLGSTLISSQLN